MTVTFPIAECARARMKMAATVKQLPLQTILIMQTFCNPTKSSNSRSVKIPNCAANRPEYSWHLSMSRLLHDDLSVIIDSVVFEYKIHDNCAESNIPDVR